MSRIYAKSDEGVKTFSVGIIPSDEGNRYFLAGVEIDVDDLIDHINFLSQPVKPEPQTLEERVQAAYPDKDFVMLEWRGERLLIFNRFNCVHYHIEAQSMKGYYTYIYEHEDLDDKEGFFDWNHPSYQRDKYSQAPVACLFSEVDS